MQGACIAAAGTQLVHSKTKEVGQTVDLYPSLTDIAVIYMSVHATACAPERRWGSLYDKKRNALDIQQGKKIIFLRENDAEGTAVAEMRSFYSSRPCQRVAIAARTCKVLQQCILSLVHCNEPCALQTTYFADKRRQQAQ
jgi:hypothetical protein